ncbi:MAG: apolipoprotein N-acyltransferase [Pseudomonadota bacterium]
MISSASQTQQRQFLLDAAISLTRVEGWRRSGVAFGFGVLTATALAPYYFLPALLLGLSGLVFLLDSTRTARRPLRSAFVTGWAFGFGYFLFGMYWLAFAFLVQAEQFAWMIPIAVPAFTGFLGLFVGGACLLTALAWRQPSFGKGAMRLFPFVAAFCLFEFARGTVLTGLPWNLVGQSVAGNALLAQLAAWVGPYGLSLVVMLICVSPAGALDIERKVWRLRPLACGLLGIVGVVVFGAVRLSLPVPPSVSDTHLVIAQPNIPQREKFDPDKMIPNFERLVAMTAEAVPEGGRALAVWPENAFPFLAQDPGAPAFFGAALPATTHLLSGTYRSYEVDGQRKDANSAVFFGATNGLGQKPVAGVYDKHHLVPFGEYLPLKGFVTALGLSQLAPVQDGFTPGPGPTTIEMDGIRFAPLICYEDVFPLALYPKDNRPDLLVVVTNDAWFGDNAGPRQHLDISRLRAIESGLPMARSANTGISGLFNGKGQLLDQIPLYEEGILTAPLPPALKRPLYDRVGTPIFALLLLLVASFPRISGLARWG